MSATPPRPFSFAPSAMGHDRPRAGFQFPEIFRPLLKVVRKLATLLRTQRAGRPYADRDVFARIAWTFDNPAPLAASCNACRNSSRFS